MDSILDDPKTLRKARLVEFPHLEDEESEIQRDGVLCPRSHS